MPDPSTTPGNPMERERVVITALMVLLLVLWLGFAVHRSPRFPGSLAGTLLGIAGAVVMIVPSLTYTVIKRISGLKQRVTRRIALRTLLTWHVWGGLLGGVLAILHTGHRFESTLGMSLTGVMLVVIFSGYVGRHFLGTVSLELRDRQALLEKLVVAYNGVAGALATHPSQVVASFTRPSAWSRLQRGFGFAPMPLDAETYALARRATELAGTIADVEYGIKTNELMKRRFKAWLVVHIVGSAVFYGLLALHIWASLSFGMRWLD